MTELPSFLKDKPICVDEYGVAYSEDRKTLIYCPAEFKGEYIIPEGVTKIDCEAFEECENLTGITLPDSLLNIDDCAFFGCTALKAIHLPEGLLSMGSTAFGNCSSLTSINIPDSLMSFGNNGMPFLRCNSLPVIDGMRYADTYLVETADKTRSSYTIKEGTRFIGDDAFGWTPDVEEIIIPNSVISIENHAFFDCKKLKTIVIPDSVTRIGDNAFYGSGIESITIPDSVTHIGALAFDQCYNLSSISIPESVTYLGARAFGSCHSLTSVIIPNGVKHIGNLTFYDCENLQSITLPESVTFIQDGRYEALLDCKKLKEIIVPKGHKQRFEIMLEFSINKLGFQIVEN